MHAMENKKAIEYIKAWVSHYNNNVLNLNCDWEYECNYIEQINAMISLFNTCEVAHRINLIEYEEHMPITITFSE